MGFLKDGKCEGTTFFFKDPEFTDVYVTDQLKFSLYSFSASPKSESSDSIMPTHYTCPYSKDSCVDGTGTNYSWEITSKSACGFDEYTILYEGISSTIYDSNNSTIYFANTLSNVQFRLAKFGLLALASLVLTYAALVRY